LLLCPLGGLWKPMSAAFDHSAPSARFSSWESNSRIRSFRHHRWIGAVIIFTVALTLRLISYADIRDSPLFHNTVPLADARYYDFRAKAIAGGDWLGEEVFFLAPLYEYTVAIPYALTGQTIEDRDRRLARERINLDPAIYVQCVYGSLTCVLLYLLGGQLFGTIGAWISGMTTALYGPFILFDGLLMATSLVLFTGVVALYLLIRADRRDRLLDWLWGGLATGMSAIAHGLMLSVAPVVALLILVTWRRRGVRPTIARAGIFTAGAFVAVLPVTVRNYVVGRDLVLLTSNAGMNFFIGNNETAIGTHVIYQFPYRLTSLRDYYVHGKRGPDDLPPSEVSRRVASRAWGWIRTNPADALRLWLIKLALFFDSTELGIRDHYHFLRQFSLVLRQPLVSFGIIAPIGLTGAVCLARRLTRLRMIYLFLFTQALATSLMFVLGRYRFVAAACLILLAAGQVTWWIDRVAARQLRPLFGSGVLLILFAIGVHAHVGGLDETTGTAKLFSRLGRTYLARAEGDPEARRLARAAFAKAASLPWTVKDLPESRSAVLMMLGDLDAQQNRVESAVKWWTLALEAVHKERQMQRGDYLPTCPPLAYVQRRAKALQTRLEAAKRHMEKQERDGKRQSVIE